MEQKVFEVYCDASYDTQTKFACCSFLIKERGKQKILSHTVYKLGNVTDNNIAEILSLQLALKNLTKHISSKSHCIFYSDNTTAICTFKNELKKKPFYKDYIESLKESLEKEGYTFSIEKLKGHVKLKQRNHQEDHHSKVDSSSRVQLRKIVKEETNKIVVK